MKGSPKGVVLSDLRVKCYGCGEITGPYLNYNTAQGAADACCGNKACPNSWQGWPWERKEA